MFSQEWNLTKIPPKNDTDVAEFTYNLFEIARLEKERLNKNNDFLANYALYRGRPNRQTTGRKGFSQQTRGLVPINLYFANVERTVSNITARNPTGEVVDLDGTGDGADGLLSMALKKWWKDTDQQQKTRMTARQMEIYGITIEKPVWDTDRDQPNIMLTDPFSFFPAPGYYEDISEEAPYIAFAYIDLVSKIEADFKVKDVAHDEAYELLGAQREDFKPQSYNPNQTIGNYADPMTIRAVTQRTVDNKTIHRGLIVEVWIRDNSTKSTKTEDPVLDDQGQPVLDEAGSPMIAVTTKDEPVYRDGVRKITITKSTSPDAKQGWVVVDDSANPNLNPAMPDELARFTFPWGKLPVYFANSYKDQISIWGFAAAEQTADLLNKINLIVNKLIAYVINVMAPPLIVQQHCGITRDMIESSIQKAGRLILMPSTPNAVIKFLEIPNLPQTFFQVLDLIMKMFDRIYQIEEADRGNAPRRIIAAQAIVALQERNQVLMQAKTVAIDSIAENRSRWAIGLWMNKGTRTDHVNVGGEQKEFTGVQLAGRKFNYVVEAGSTTPRTSLQIQELAMKLYEAKAIGQHGLLETINWPNWKEELMRTADNQLDQALNVLIEAGLPEEFAMQLKQMVSQIQASANEKKNSAGTPKSAAGAVPAAPAAPAPRGQ